jgi:chromosome segregation ATPase
MEIQPLTQTDKDTILAMARTLASRSVSAGGAQTAQPATQARDQLAEFDRRLELMNREVNARLAEMSHSIEIMQRKIAGLSGDFQAVRVALVEIETQLEQEHDHVIASVDTMLQRLMSELSGPLDNIALVANDTAMVQQELAQLARQLTTAQGGGGRV